MQEPEGGLGLCHSLHKRRSHLFTQHEAASLILVSLNAAKAVNHLGLNTAL
jgi:hypothetical protein